MSWPYGWFDVKPQYLSVSQCFTFTSAIEHWPIEFSNVRFVFAQPDTVSDNFMRPADARPINLQCQRTRHLHFCWQKSDWLVMIQCVAEIESRKTKFRQTAGDIFCQREYCPLSYRPKCRLLKVCTGAPAVLCLVSRNFLARGAAALAMSIITLSCRTDVIIIWEQNKRKTSTKHVK